MSKTSQNHKKHTSTKITAEQTIIIIRLIKKYKCIWDTNHTDFRNRQIRNNAFKKIGSYFKLTAEDVRRKYRRFRNCYTQELKQIREHKKPYTNLFYFDEMDFLREQIEQQRSHSALNRSPSSGVELDMQPTDDRNTDIDEIPIESLDDDAYPLEPIEEYHFSSNDSSHSDHTNTTKASSFIKESAISTEPHIEEQVSRFKEEIELSLESNIGEEYPIEEMHIENDPKSPPIIDKGDEFDVFAGYLACQLREMDKLSALETMEEMQHIIFRRRIQILKKDHQKNN